MNGCTASTSSPLLILTGPSKLVYLGKMSLCSCGSSKVYFLNDSESMLMMERSSRPIERSRRPDRWSGPGDWFRRHVRTRNLITIHRYLRARAHYRNTMKYRLKSAPVGLAKSIKLASVLPTASTWRSNFDLGMHLMGTNATGNNFLLKVSDIIRQIIPGVFGAYLCGRAISSSKI